MRLFAPSFSLILLFFLSAQALLYPEAGQNLSSPPEIPSSESTLVVKAMLSNGSAMASYPLIILVRSESSLSVLRSISDPAGQIVLSGVSGKVDLDAVSNLPQTEGVDFASTSSANAAVNGSFATMVFYPAGSVTGTVAQNGSPVAYANISVSCPSNSFDFERINGKVEAKGGAFSILALPTGKCIVSASYGGAVSSSEVQVAQGETSSIYLELYKAAPPTDPSPPVIPESQLEPIAIGGAALLLLAALLAIYSFAVKSKSKAKEIPSSPNAAIGHAGPVSKRRSNNIRTAPRPGGASQSPAQKLPLSGAPSGKAAFNINSQHVQAVLSTLSEREAEIVRFIFSQGGRAKRSTMQHKLLIPKTSMVRNLRALERKNVVKLIPFGRNLVAEISDWLKN